MRSRGGIQPDNLRIRDYAEIAQVFQFGPSMSIRLSLRIQVPNNHILAPKLYYNYYYPNPKYLTIGYTDPLG